MVTALLHVLAAFSIIYFARAVFYDRAKNPYELLAATIGVIVLNIFTGWPVHAAAGIMLGLLFPLAFSRSQNRWPMLWALTSAAALALTGAGWVLIPAAVAAVLWVLQSGVRVDRWGWSTLGSTRKPELAEHAGGLPMTDVQQGEAVPVTAQAKPAPASQAAAPSDALSQLHLESRLPAEARAQLVTLDSVSAEALGVLEQPGQSKGEKVYQLRAIRSEYAPNVVRAYLRLPPTLADTALLEGNKTGRDLLTEQLELLITATRDILRRSAEVSSQELLSNGRFLRDKFGPPNRDLEV